VNWELMARKKIDPPYRPKVRNSRDTANFDKMFTEEKVEESFEDEALISPSPNEFSGFTYKDAGELEIVENI
jgi:hypothetical protein